MELIKPVAILLFLFLWFKLSVSQDGFRLPTAIVPKKYDLYLTIMHENSSFHGKVFIKVFVKVETNKIVLNAKNLNITTRLTVQCLSNRSQIVGVESIKPFNLIDMVHININGSLVPDNFYLVTVEFVGHLNDEVDGLYQYMYTELDDNTQRSMIAASCKYLGARMIFPCFDEPHFKTPIALNIGRRKNESSLSTMPVESTKVLNNNTDLVWDIYQETPPIATHEFTLVVADLQYEECRKIFRHNVTIRIYGRRSILKYTEFAKSVLPHFLNHFEDFFSIKYPLPKLDIVILPHISQGYTENMGLAILREDIFLAALSSPDTLKNEVAYTLGHLFSMIFLGCIVSSRLWYEIWFPEAFAVYISPLSAEKVLPNWNSWRFNYGTNIETVLERDMEQRAQSVMLPIQNMSPDEIVDRALEQSRVKKASILFNMLFYIVGESVFRHALQKYITTYRFGTASLYDFWGMLTASAHANEALPKNVTINDIMRNWLLKPGYPTIKVKQNYEIGWADLEQERCLRKKQIIDPTLWYIPLTYKTRREVEGSPGVIKEWITDKDKVFNLEMFKIKNTDWFLLNNEGVALYRVQYEVNNWNNLITCLYNEMCLKQLSAINKMALIDDAMQFAWQNELDYKIAFKLFNYVRNETEYLPWQAAAIALSKLDNALRRIPKLYSYFKDYVAHIMKPMFSEELFTRFSTTLHSEKKNIIVSIWACRAEIPECIDSVKTIYKKWKLATTHEKSTMIIPTAKFVVFCNAIKHGEYDDWNYMFYHLHNTNSTDDKKNALLALTCTKDETLLKRYMSLLLPNKLQIPIMDRQSIFLQFVTNPWAFNLSKEFVYTHIKTYNIDTKYDEMRSLYLMMLSCVSANLNTRLEITEMKDFMFKHNTHLRRFMVFLEDNLDLSEGTITWLNTHEAKLPELFTDLINNS